MDAAMDHLRFQVEHLRPHVEHLRSNVEDLFSKYEHLLPNAEQYSTILIAIPTIVCLYAGYLVVYRLWFSPIAHFPGPKIAAITTWYETYYDLWHKGKFVFQIEEMHKKYGKIKSPA
jgi:hypothetical protein